ncbi:MAG: hypothetical protein GY774_24560 [Planctomycetes bacterium]|nr:hypothetical protein [Planctomycetota bacterium]
MNLFLAFNLILCGMACSVAIVRQPEEFKYGESFDLFFRMFCNYAKNVQCDPAAQYNLLLSYLDKKSFMLVERIAYTEHETTAINTDINAAFPKLQKALTPADKMPAKIELKFRKQQQNENLSDFGLAIQTLGTSAFGTGAVNNGQVIDAFCMGVKDTALSAKLLNTEFATLSGAITFAQEKENEMAIVQFVAKNRGTAGDRSCNDNVPHSQAEETEVDTIDALELTDDPSQQKEPCRISGSDMTPNRYGVLDQQGGTLMEV